MPGSRISVPIGMATDIGEFLKHWTAQAWLIFMANQQPGTTYNRDIREQYLSTERPRSISIERLERDCVCMQPSTLKGLYRACGYLRLQRPVQSQYAIIIPLLKECLTIQFYI